MSVNQEPVVWAAALNALLIAALAVINEIWNISDSLMTALSGLIVAVVGFVAVLVRSKVTPVEVNE